ncbi:D-2-hydroxyacid dehydrogenase family protein [Candidimonas sp. SYP-B2681]|uniref:D-2-hydroxyacid dehydrogenase family protein n=1 Tax=Candidimonas sp. SYP-B2681 TaxID=2497686 RepID=UPI000F86D6AB|nr:D-2-hydroxyacid dehydrogenase family protein [Candidimonas sp. SYP-B2681]RTZ45646.1 D-2-hydroxyacid dehydrogenase family protein [Candidimonas sp. SYP-B2681]
MHIVIPDDYQDCVRHLDSFSKLEGHKVTIFNDSVTNVDELAARFSGAEALVLIRERTQITAELLDKLPDLRVISQTAKVSGHIDLAACTERGIAVVEGFGGPTATAELAWTLIMASRRYLVAEVNRLNGGSWQGFLGHQLHGQTLGVWSYGRIGKLVAGYGRAFGMKVWVWGRSESMARAQADGFDVAPSRDQFFADSDVVSIHLRLNADTEGIVTQADLAQMKKTALFVNTSRAELVAPKALVHALDAGRPGFAAVDVYENEPVLGATHPLLNRANVLCTPHIGYVERESYELYLGTAFDNLMAFCANRPVNVVNPDFASHI